MGRLSLKYSASRFRRKADAVSLPETIQVNKENYQLNAFMDNFTLYAKDLDLKATVLISADRTLDYGVVMLVLAAVKQAGFTDVSLATNG